jgi:hypothetical protein
MDPQRELALVAARKRALRERIAHRRRLVAKEFIRVEKPLAWLDRAVALWREIPTVAKLAVVPLGLVLIKKIFFRHKKMLAPLLRWAPTIFKAVQGMKAPVETE